MIWDLLAVVGIFLYLGVAMIVHEVLFDGGLHPIYFIVSLVWPILLFVTLILLWVMFCSRIGEKIKEKMEK